MGDAGEGEGASEDAEQVAKKLGDPLPGLSYDIMWHGNVLRVCAVVTQLTIENGEPLFEVEYKD